MNYRDFFKKKATKTFLPEGVSMEQLKKGVIAEAKSTKDWSIAAKLALRHLREDASYYDKISGEDQEGDETGAEVEIDADSKEGMPTVGGALAVPHVGQPIHMSKIIQVGKMSGEPASGEVSGFTAVGKDSSAKGGVKVSADGDKETITAGGKKVDGSIASKSVGGEVVPGEGQEQAGPNHKGCIAGTAKLNESVKTQPKVGMKAGPSYKVVQPTQCKTVNQDTARTNQYEPEITEGCDEEEVDKMKSRFAELVTAPRNLKESELSEMNSLKLKLETIEANGTSYKVVAPTLAHVQTDDHARAVQSCPDLTETDEMETQKMMSKLDQLSGSGVKINNKHRSRMLGAAKFKDLEKIKADIAAKRKPEDPDDRFDNSTYHEPRIEAPPFALTGDTGNVGDEDEDEITEAGGGTVQHRSFRTIKDAPQNPEARKDNEVDENKEPKKSETVKKIEKSNKDKKKSSTTDDMKYKATPKTKSGVIKQKK
jgi:hypothetical protein